MSIKNKLDELMDAIRDRIANVDVDVDVYQSPWESIESGSDAYGEFSRDGNTTKNQIGSAGYWRLTTSTFLTVPGSFTNASEDVNPSGSSYDLTSGSQDCCMRTQQPANNYVRFALPPNIHRLILPSNFSYWYVTATAPKVVYLSKTSISNSSSWIGRSAVRNDYDSVKCPPDANVPYYLNNFKLPRSDMVNIFNNMVDRSSETTVKYITLGTDNLSRLTDADKQIAYSKGWDLQ